MKVSSPIGDLPFKPTRLQVKDKSIHMDGSMGAWPAHVQIEVSDMLDIAYLLRYILLALLTGIMVLVSIILVRK